MQSGCVNGEFGNSYSYKLQARTVSNLARWFLSQSSTVLLARHPVEIPVDIVTPTNLQYLSAVGKRRQLLEKNFNLT